MIIAGEILDNPCLSGWQDAAGVGLPNAAGRDLLRRLLQWDPNERIQAQAGCEMLWLVWPNSDDILLKTVSCAIETPGFAIFAQMYL